MRAYVAILLYTVGLTVNAQNYITPIKSDLIPPAPQSSRPIEYQMPQPSMLTGAVDLSIPLYTVKCGDYSFPLYMQYHSNGIKVADDPSPNGYGWSMMPALRATRTVLGRPDELFDYPTDAYRDIMGVAFMSMVNPHAPSQRFPDRFDSQHDIFSFALPGHTVIRVLDMTGGTPQFKGGCDTEYKVTADTALDSITVTDGEGIEYVFGEPNEIQPNPHVSNCRTCWALNEIRTPGGESIRLDWGCFRHSFSGYNYLGGYSFFDRFNEHEWWNSGVDIDSFNSSNYENTIFQTYDETFYYIGLLGIEFPGGNITIEHNGWMKGSMMTKMTISNGSDVIKSVDFVYDSSGLRLSELHLSDEGTYKMAYTEGSKVDLNVHSQDWWGYYNAKNNNSLTPKIRLKRYRWQQSEGGYYHLLGEADRSIDAAAMQNNMLKRITYPAGGCCEFEYEPHKFAPVRDENGADEIDPATNPYLSEGGGLRVKRITAYPKAYGTENQVVEYEYSLARVRNVPSVATFVDVCEAAIGLMDVDYSSRCVDYLRSVNVRPFSEYMRYDIGETPLWYETVTARYAQGSIRYKHKDILEFPNVIITDYGFRTHGGLHKVFSQGPQLVSKETFAMTDGSEKLVEKDSLTYDKIYNGVAAYSSQIVRKVIYAFTSEGCAPDLYDSNEIRETQTTHFQIDRDPYEITPYGITVYSERLIKKSHTLYTDNGPITTEQTYAYKDKSTSLITKVTTSTSDGTGKTTDISYADDCDGAVEAMMQAANVVSVPIVEKTQKSDVSVEHRAAYQRVGSGAFVPRQVTTRFGQNAATLSSPRIACNAQGRTVEAVDADGIATTWLWGYGNLHPVYKIEGMDYHAVCATAPQARNSADADTYPLDCGTAAVWRYGFRPHAYQTRLQAPWGTVTDYSHDSGNRLTEIRRNGKLTARYDYYLGHGHDAVSENVYFNNDSVYTTSVSFDGFGREIVALFDEYKGAVYTEYDAMGRQWRKTPMLGVDLDPDSDDVWNVTGYEASPRAVVESVMRAGGEWRRAGVRSSSRRLANTPAGRYACPRYTVGADGITLRGNYDGGMLLVSESTDEDGHIVREFSDMDGLVVMTAEGNDADMLRTRRVYDAYGRLRAVLPPDVADGSYYFSDAVMQNKAYVYHYDALGRCVSSKNPGCEAALTRYSRAGRVIAEHTPGMAAGRWLMHFYDRCGREVLTSLAAATEQQLQSVADSLPVAVYEASAPGCYRLAPALPMPVGTPQKAAFYDSYDFLDSVVDSLPALTRTSRATGLQTGSRDFAAVPSKTLTTALAYDADGRVAEKSEQTINGTVHTTCSYDRQGNVLTERSVHTPRGYAPIVRVVTTDYNAAGRVARRRVTENGSEAELSFAYDDCGRLASERLSNGVARRHTYNIHGWPLLTETEVPVELKNIKDSLVQILPELTPSYYSRIIGGIDTARIEPVNPNPPVTPARFTTTYTDRLLYTDGANPRYGGCPSARINSLGGRYDYTFDPHDRLLRAYYTPGEKADTDEDFTVTYAYDELARPLEVERAGIVAVDADGKEDFGLLDELLYSYDDSGAPESIHKQFEGEEYYGRPGFPPRDGLYTRNKAGCIISDSSRGIDKISYNHRNLPTKISFSDGHTATNYYSADGVLLRSIVHSPKTGSGITALLPKTISSKDYVADRVFERGKLKYSYFPGGYFDGNGGVHYLHSDYQGSIVMVTDSAGRVEQHNTYYPYGEPHRTPSGQPILYSGKERRSLTGEYNYGARFHFAPALLWSVPDALADRMPGVSPYVFCNANPVGNIDPDGNSPTIVTALVGAAAGALGYAAVEFIIQMFDEDDMDWDAVKGAGARGAIVGGATGLTLGAGTAVAVAATAGANVVGGYADRAVQGKETTAADVAVDAVVGGGSAALGSVAGNAAKKALDNASRTVKGKIGERVTHLKYNAKGYRRVKNKTYDVPTGTLKKNGRNREARYDFLFEHIITGKRIVRESKFNTSGLTPNQRAAWNRSKYPIEIDRTTSDDIGRWVQQTTMLAPALTPAQ